MGSIELTGSLPQALAAYRTLWRSTAPFLNRNHLFSWSALPRGKNSTIPYGTFLSYPSPLRGLRRDLWHPLFAYFLSYLCNSLAYDSTLTLPFSLVPASSALLYLYSVCGSVSSLCLKYLTHAPSCSHRDPPRQFFGLPAVSVFILCLGAFILYVTSPLWPTRNCCARLKTTFSIPPLVHTTQFFLFPHPYFYYTYFQD